MIVACEGDYGDAVLVLAVLSAIENGPHKLVLRKSTVTKVRTEESLDRFLGMVKPLAEAQSYIEECRKLEPSDVIEWDSGGFRGAGTHNPMATLINAHVRHLLMVNRTAGDVKIKNDTPWVSAKPSPRSSGRVIINRTFRYQNPHFPWRKIVEFYGDRLLFVGSSAEHEGFSATFGAVEKIHTANLLEIAELIAGSMLFIGNQSCANAVAEGLKHRTIQEVSLTMPDCIYARENAQHVVSGACVLPGYEGKEDLQVQPAGVSPADVDTITAPPGEWQIVTPDGETKRSRSFSGIISAGAVYGMTREQVIEENVRRQHDYFFKAAYGSQFSIAHSALENAGIFK